MCKPGNVCIFQVVFCCTRCICSKLYHKAQWTLRILTSTFCGEEYYECGCVSLLWKVLSFEATWVCKNVTYLVLSKQEAWLVVCASCP